MTLHRPYIRREVREEVERRAERNEKGEFLDANTHRPIEPHYEIGHKAGHEYWREAERAEAEGLTQPEFNDRMNNPDYYQIEDSRENRSHAHELPAEKRKKEPEKKQGKEQKKEPGKKQEEKQEKEQGKKQKKEQEEVQEEEQGLGM